jgi:CDGSH-type Zn-finger protein
MANPEIPQKAPYGMKLEPGTYWWCACGRSNNQPFCDGSHEGTAFAPVKTEIQTPKNVWLCGCKHTKGPPFCDGSHNDL